MAFFKKVLQSFLNEYKEDIIEKDDLIIYNKNIDDESIIDDDIDEYAYDIDYDEFKEKNDEDDETNYRDKDKEAKLNYINKIKEKAAIVVEKLKNNSKNNFINKNKEGKNEDEYGFKTSERNLNREIGGMERDYKKELEEELKLRSNKRKKFRMMMEAFKNIQRRRFRRFRINRGFIRRIYGKVINLKRLRSSLRGSLYLINLRALIKKRNLNIKKIKNAYKKVRNAKRIEAMKIKMYNMRKKEDKQKKYFQEMIKAKKNKAKAIKNIRSIT